MIYCSLNSISLLGGSQTFLGVLATIVILCVFAGNNNFIYSMLSDIKNRISCEISSLKKITTIDTALKCSKDYKLLNYFLLQKDISADLRNKGTQLSAKISSVYQNFQVSYVNVEDKKEKVFSQIGLSMEQLLAPLYSFFFCITIFVFDETFDSLGVEYVSLLLSFLSIFILNSYVFWLIVWIAFMNRIKIYDDPNNELENNPQNQKRNYFSKCWNLAGSFIISKRIRVAFFIKALVCSLFLAFCLFFAYYLSLCSVIIAIGIAIPVFSIGLLRVYFHSQKGDYTYLFLTGHYLAILFMSFILAIVIYGLTSYFGYLSSVLFPYIGCFWLKVSIFTFVVLNGLILPFVLPYYKYDSFLATAKRKVYESKMEAKKIADQLKNELDSFCEKIPPV